MTNQTARDDARFIVREAVSDLSRGDALRVLFDQARAVLADAVRRPHWRRRLRRAWFRVLGLPTVRVRIFLDGDTIWTTEVPADLAGWEKAVLLQRLRHAMEAFGAPGNPLA